MRSFGIKTIQNSEFKIKTDSDDKLEAVTEYPFPRKRRKQFDQLLNQIEKTLFAYTNSSPGWIGTAASPFCSFYASYLQQEASDLKCATLLIGSTLFSSLRNLAQRLHTIDLPTTKKIRTQCTLVCWFIPHWWLWKVGYSHRTFSWKNEEQINLLCRPLDVTQG